MKQIKLWATLLLFMATAVAAQSQPSQTGTQADLRCMAVMAKINQLPDPKHQLESLIGGYYYLGRLEAVAPAGDLGAQTAAAYTSMSPVEFLTETSRCEKEMQTSGHAITQIGDAMRGQPKEK